MERKIEDFYLKWKKDKSRKPLVIYGGKQVGKTFSALEFGRKEYKNIALFGDYSETTMGVNAFGGFGINMFGAFIVETILTFVFIITILGVTSDKKYSAISGVVIGLALTFVHLLGIKLTGTSVNPARSIGPAIFVGGKALQQVWLFILAPLFGSALAAITYKFVSNEK